MIIKEDNNQKEKQYCLVNTDTGAIEKQGVYLDENTAREKNKAYGLNKSSLKWVELLKG